MLRHQKEVNDTQHSYHGKSVAVSGDYVVISEPGRKSSCFFTIKKLKLG